MKIMLKRYFSVFLVLMFGPCSVLMAQMPWSKYPANPVLSTGSPGSWDDKAISNPNVVYDGETYHMWYSGRRAGSGYNIGYASSSDGVNWVKYDDPGTNQPLLDESDPVLTCGPAGSWDKKSVHHPTVVYYENTFYMWYHGQNDDLSHGSALTCIGYATSEDGIHWTKYDKPATTTPLLKESDPVMLQGKAGDWDDFAISWNNVLYNGHFFQMWYGGKHADLNGSWEIGYATSHNGREWTKYPDNPIMVPDEPWADMHMMPTSVRLIDGVYHMWYGGYGSDGLYQTGYATSWNGVFWDKDPDNPCLRVGFTGQWDDLRAWGANVHFDEAANLFKMWYHGYHNCDGKYRIGYATAPLITTAVEPLSPIKTDEYSLSQNYPNPFNPSTVIEFSIPEAGFVSLSVYNTLGEKVAVLAEENLTAGVYQYNWHAAELPGGVYFYRLQAGNHKEVRKAVILK